MSLGGPFQSPFVPYSNYLPRARPAFLTYLESPYLLNCSGTYTTEMS